MDNSTVMQPPQLNTGRLLLLGASSVILCLSFIMAVFAPFPLALAVILYGRTKGILTGVLGLVVTFVFATFLYQDLTLFGFYAGVFVLALGIAEIVNRNIAPVKGVIAFGLGFIAVLSLSLGLTLKSLQVTPEQFVLTKIQESADKIAEQKKIFEQSSAQNSVEVLQLLDHPELIAKEIVESFPSYLFIGVFLMLWFNTFMVLKSRRLLLSAQVYPYTERNLLNFKVPFEFVIVLVAGLVLAIWGADFGGSIYESIGMTVIRCLGIFYFFQGFGVFSDLLSFLGIMGFFRTLIVMIVVFMANYLIAAAGLFDNWFDFRKYFIKRKTEE